ncbi:serine/threonine-protein kinase [Streptomyces sp. NPDC050504]|uniref:serine/threonine-protein kinase n=1 Tax=Streptomyces sp. NPDC050504 TaxID=3365618 RepID=UPI0037BE0D44
MERGELIAGRYELVKRLGRGGMGEVWAGRDRDLHRDVALKLLVLDDASYPDLPKRFDREAVAAAQINHPGVVGLYDRGVHEDVLFIVMEKVTGATLAEHVRTEGPMPPARAVAIARDICDALAAAHRAHVIHYDIKPHNVMLTADGRVKVVDFGIAGFVQNTFSVARSSQLAPAGTPEYGAPEQFLTERGDERSDLYALGGVLFAMLVGHAPFTGHNGLSIMRRKLEEDAPRLADLRPDLPEPLTALVAELLDRDPARRPGSAQGVLGRLAAYAGAPVLPAAPAPSVPPVPPVPPVRPAGPTGPVRATGPAHAKAPARPSEPVHSSEPVRPVMPAPAPTGPGSFGPPGSYDLVDDDDFDLGPGRRRRMRTGLLVTAVVLLALCGGAYGG